MTQDKQAVETPESAETQDAPSPEVEQKTVSSVEDTVEIEPRLADKTQERIRGFKHKLDEKDQMINDLSQQIQELRNPKMPNVDVPDLKQFVDSEGRVDIQGLNKAFQDVISNANEARNVVQGYIRNQQEIEAYQSYPQLEPDTQNFDEKLHRTTRAILTDSMMNPQDYGSRPLTFKEAADLASNMNPKEKEKIEKQAREEVYDQISTKEAATMEATGTPARRGAIKSDQELESLRLATRAGNIDAIAERLKNIPK